MLILPCYRLPLYLHKHVLAPGLSAPPLTLHLDMRVATPDELGPVPDTLEGTHAERLCGSTLDNAESHVRGSFNFDWEKGDFSHEWASLAKFDKWRQEEECVYSIEFIPSSTLAGGKHWSWRQLFVCRCERSGGYVKQHPRRENKIGNRKSGCHCEIIIKQYPHTSIVLGCYIAKHNHKVGFANITYLCLSSTAQERIKAMLTQKVEHHEIVSCLAESKNILAADLIHLQVRTISADAPDGTRNLLIALEEVNRIAQALENDKIRLHPDNAVSTKLLIEELSGKGTLTFYKDKQDHAPIDSRLPEDAFVLCIQTDFQLDAFQCLGNGFIGIDATHNITQYQDLLLFTIIARDNWGHGK